MGALGSLALATRPADVARANPGDEMAVLGPPASVAVGAEFDAEVHITQADTGYNGYRAWLEWDSTILAYVDPPGVTYTGLGTMLLDATPFVLADGVQLGSARMTAISNETGKAADVRLECIATGTSSLHLVTPVEDPTLGTTQLAPYGVVIPTTLVDDSVTCGASTATPTATAPAPVGGVAEVRPLDGASAAASGAPLETSGSPAALHGAIAGGAALLVVLLGGGWYAWRRILR